MITEERIQKLLELVDNNPTKEVPIIEAIEVLYTTLQMTYDKAHEIKLDAETANYFYSTVLCSFIATMASYKNVGVKQAIEDLFKESNGQFIQIEKEQKKN